MGYFFTQFSPEDRASGVAGEEMRHEPLSYFSGKFKDTQLRWLIVNKETFAIVGERRRGEWMLHDGDTLFSDDRKLAYMFPPTVVVAKLSKTTAQWLLHWRAYLGQFCSEIMYIPGENNCWGNLPSRGGRAGTDPQGEVSGSVGCRKIAARARMPTMHCRRRVPFRAVTFGRWRWRVWWGKSPRRVRQHGLTGQDCSGCLTALSWFC